MPRRVSNEYKTNGDAALHLVSPGVYEVVALVNVADIAAMQAHSWCYEQTKGLIYTMDLTQRLPRAMGYNTPRVYLRDFILYINGHDHRKVIWHRRSLHDYRLDASTLLKVSC